MPGSEFELPLFRGRTGHPIHLLGEVVSNGARDPVESNLRVLVLQPPSPPGLNVKRDYAGGYGVADPSPRTEFGHDESYTTLPYMSLLYCAAILEAAGYPVTFLDAQAERLGLEALRDRVRGAAPDIILSVLNLPSVYGDITVLKTLKEDRPSSRIIGIGTVCRALKDLILNSGAVDEVVLGDPEIVLLQMVRRPEGTGPIPGVAFKRDGKIVTNPGIPRIENLDALPIPAYHLAPLQEYRYHVFGKGVEYAPVFASRGCHYDCYYCPYPFGFGEKIVYRKPEAVVNEIEVLVKKYGVNRILFRDQIFSMNPRITEAICDLLISRKLNTQWVIETRLDRVTEPLLRKMKAAGCKRIHYGLESGDPTLFKTVGKGGVKTDMDALAESISMTERVGVDAHAFILIGLLGEDWTTIRNTIETLRRLKPLTMQVSIVTPYPGTELYEQGKKKGLILTDDWSKYTGFYPVMRTEKLSAEDLLAAKALLQKEHRKIVVFKRLRRKAALLRQYTLDGSIWGRVYRRAVFAR